VGSYAYIFCIRLDCCCRVSCLYNYVNIVRIQLTMMFEYKAMNSSTTIVHVDEFIHLSFEHLLENKLTDFVIMNGFSFAVLINRAL
jgi:hypothetical protein